MALWIESLYIANILGILVGNYIRFSNGLQICWGIATGNGNYSFSFPQAFADTNYVVMCTDIHDSRTSNGYAYATDKTTTGFKSITGENSKAQYIAIGRWKDIN